MKVICQSHSTRSVALAYHPRDGGVLKYRLKTIFVSALCVRVLVRLRRMRRATPRRLLLFSYQCP